MDSPYLQDSSLGHLTVTELHMKPNHEAVHGSTELLVLSRSKDSPKTLGPDFLCVAVAASLGMGQKEGSELEASQSREELVLVREGSWKDL